MFLVLLLCIYMLRDVSYGLFLMLFVPFSTGVDARLPGRVLFFALCCMCFLFSMPFCSIAYLFLLPVEHVFFPLEVSLVHPP